MFKNLIKYIFLPVIVIIFCLSCSSSENNENESNTLNSNKPILSVTLQQNWIKNIGGSLNDEIKSVVLQNDNYILLGNTESVDGDLNRTLGTQDFWIVKLSSEGKIIWSKTYGGSDDDRGGTISKTTDDGFIVSGYSRSNDGNVSTNSGSYDHWIVKLDAEGNLLWEKTFGFLGDDRAFAVKQTPDEGFVTAGFLDVDNYEGPNIVPVKTNKAAKSLKTLHGVGEFWVHKLDKNGIKEWEKFFGGSSNDRANDIVVTNEGHFILIGATESNDFDISNNKGSYDYWVVKINALGDLIWEKTFGGSGIDIANAITQTNDGNYVIIGDSRSADGDVNENKGNADVWIIKINTNGDLLEQLSIGGTDFDTAQDIFETKSGTFLISGHTRSKDGDVLNSKNENDYYIAEIDQDLKLQWSSAFGGDSFDFAYGILEDNNGNILVVGDSESADTQIKNKGKKDALVISLSK